MHSTKTPEQTLVVFDLDGTVVDAFRDIQAAVNHAMERHGLPVHDLETIRRFVGNGLSLLTQRAVPEDRHELLPEIERDVRTFYSQHPADKATVYAGVPEAIGRLRQDGFATALLSNKPDDLVQPALDRLKIRALFDEAFGERPGVALKPDARALLDIRDRLSRPRVIMVGDGRPDGLVAENAGAAFVGVAWGMSAAETLGPYGPVADDPEHMERLLRKLAAAE